MKLLKDLPDGSMFLFGGVVFKRLRQCGYLITHVEDLKQECFDIDNSILIACKMNNVMMYLGDHCGVKQITIKK